MEYEQYFSFSGHALTIAVAVASAVCCMATVRLQSIYLFKRRRHTMA